MRDWKRLYKRIGPLRYQASESDCVPTTVVNGLIVVMETQLKPRLLQLVWNVSIDSKAGTGCVGSQVISDVLNAWFSRARDDGYEKSRLPFKSEIVEGGKVHLDRNNPIGRCLNGGGVVCITTKNGTHYSLILAEDNGKYMLFDPWWSPSRSKDDFLDYHGLVNQVWDRDRLLDELKKPNNKWIHLISKVAQQDE